MQPLFHWIRQGLSFRSDPISTETVELTTLGPARFSTDSHVQHQDSPDAVVAPLFHHDTSVTTENSECYGILTGHGHSAMTTFSEEELDHSLSRWLSVAAVTFTILLFLSTGSATTLDNHQLQKEETLKEMILRSTNNPLAFDDTDSPQSRALEWIQSDEGGGKLGLSHQRILSRYALAVLYFSTRGPEWHQRAPPFLNSQNECQWQKSMDGVICNSGIVEELILSYDGLTGSVPEEIRLLSNLRVLNLAENDLTGSFPWDYLPTSQLQTLDLSYNELSGTVPWDDFVPSVKLLETLSLEYSGLSLGSNLPLHGLENMVTLTLSYTDMAGSFPSIVAGMAKLKSLHLSNNRLVGTLPTFLGKLTLLEHLDVSRNGFLGSIPSSLGGLKNLVGLRLQHNQFSGQVPSELASLPIIKRMLIDGNHLSGDFESFCSEVTCEDCFDDWYTQGDDSSWDESFNGFVFPIFTDCSNRLECSCCLECDDDD